MRLDDLGAGERDARRNASHLAEQEEGFPNVGLAHQLERALEVDHPLDNGVALREQVGGGVHQVFVLADVRL